MYVYLSVVILSIGKEFSLKKPYKLYVHFFLNSRSNISEKEKDVPHRKFKITKLNMHCILTFGNSWSRLEENT